MQRGIGARLCCQNEGVRESKCTHASLQATLRYLQKMFQPRRSPLTQNDTLQMCFVTGWAFSFIVILHFAASAELFFCSCFCFCKLSEAFLAGVSVSLL